MRINEVLKTAAGVALCLALTTGVFWSQATPAPAVTPGNASLWEVTNITIVVGQAPKTATAKVCATLDDLESPPVAVTGPQCAGQLFSSQGNTISWTTDCDVGKGTGSLIIAPDKQSFNGHVTAAKAGQDTTVHVSAVVTGTCTKPSLSGTS